MSLTFTHSSHPSKLILATWNPVKAERLRRGLSDLPFEIVWPPPGSTANVEESGSTCEENARIKARSITTPRDAIVVAEDSGLFIEALAGMPGTHTARWLPGTDRDRAKRILELLHEIREPQRAARLVSAVAVRFPDSSEVVCTGSLDGRIAVSAKSRCAVGYAGIFELASGHLLADRADPDGLAAHRRHALASANSAIRAWLARRSTMAIDPKDEH